MLNFKGGNLLSGLSLDEKTGLYNISSPVSTALNFEPINILFLFIKLRLSLSNVITIFCLSIAIVLTSLNIYIILPFTQYKSDAVLSKSLGFKGLFNITGSDLSSINSITIESFKSCRIVAVSALSSLG